MTPEAFLLARLDEDEARARGSEPFLTWAMYMDDETYTTPEPNDDSWHSQRCGYGLGETNSPCTCGVPAVVLAQVKALRSVVELHSGVHDCNGLNWEANDLGGPGWLGCPTLLSLVAIYEDHPDYDNRWAVL